MVVRNITRINIDKETDLESAKDATRWEMNGTHGNASPAQQFHSIFRQRRKSFLSSVNIPPRSISSVAHALFRLARANLPP